MSKDLGQAQQELQQKLTELRTKRKGIISRFKDKLRDRKMEMIKSSLFKK